MIDSLRILAKELFDYAGLFPPAQLTLPLALKEFSQLQTHPQQFALGKFILPANKIEEFLALTNLFPQMQNQQSSKNLQGAKDKKDGQESGTQNRASLSVILSRCTTAQETEATLAQDFNLIKKITAIPGSQIQISSIELLPPKDIVEGHTIKQIESYLKTLFTHLESMEKNCAVFFEVPLFSPPVPLFVEVLVELRKSILMHNGRFQIGVKLRTGGTTPEQVPPASTLAATVYECTRLLLPIKCTAGLHVPIPNYNEAVKAVMHGFLNVVSIISLGFYQHLNSTSNSDPILTSASSATLLFEKILTSYKYEDFRFLKDGFQIGDIFIGNKTLELIKETYFKGIGSCSFLEPIDHITQHYLS